MEAEGAEYNSRIVVQRPINADDFNGTVVVEWFNVSGGLDAAPDWLQMHTELHREGYAWVGVSAQRVGIDGGGPFGPPLKTVDSEHYGSLSHPGDSFAYDIFSQAAQAVRRPVGLDPMEGLKVERMIAVGQSQASFHLTSYYNAINPTLDIFDAYLVHSRARNSAPLSQQPQVEVPVPDVVYLREDQLEPAIMLQTETDMFSGLDYYRARQVDSQQAGFELDANGNAHGGIRTPYVDTPVATLSGLGQGAGFCDIFGTTTLFDAAQLEELYPTREGYIDAVDTSTDAAVAAGFLVPADAELIRTWARMSEKVPP